MKERNFELSPLTVDEFSMMLIGVPSGRLVAYLVWLVEEMNGRGLTISRGLVEQLAELEEKE